MFLLDVIPAGVIIVNALVMGVRLDIAPESLTWKFIDLAFLVFYTGEALVKYHGIALYLSVFLGIN